MAVYRLRSGLVVEHALTGQWQLVDAALKRVIQLGDADARLVRALAQGGTAAQLAKTTKVSADHITVQLSALARLYVLQGKRSQARVALQLEREAFARQCRQDAAQEDIAWPPGRDPPRHRCQGTGTCCGASFLGPLLPADHRRVADLTFGSRVRQGQLQRLGKNTADEDPFEVVHLGGHDHIGMARGDDQRCVAQGDDQLCDIHREHGAAAKPVACRLFPLRLHRSPQGVHVSLLLTCDGYDRARPAGEAWPQRQDEIRTLLAEGAPTVRVVVPCEWTPGLAVPFGDWLALQAQLYSCEPEQPDARRWLADAVSIAQAAIDARCAAVAEGQQVQVAARLTGVVPALRGDRQWHEKDRAESWAAALDARAADLVPRGRHHDADRLADLAAGVRAQLADYSFAAPGWSADREAQRHLHDVVANDLAVYVAIGHLDAGLTALTGRTLFVEALACALALRAGRHNVQASDTTRALHVAYRSEPDLAALHAAAC